MVATGRASGPEAARRIADTVLYEGYVLYPYRASAPKNLNPYRWQFGVLVPPGYEGEPSALRTEVVLEDAEGATVEVVLRLLQLQERRPGEEGGLTWDEGVEHEWTQRVPVEAAGDVRWEVSLPGGAESGPGPDGADSVRRRRPLDLAVHVLTRAVPAPAGSAHRLAVVVENRSAGGAEAGSRHEALRHALLSAHVVAHTDRGGFVSAVDPPPWAEALVAGCRNEGVHPVLAGPEGCTDTVLASPVVLYDHPRLAPESPGDFYDATEIDELLTLRTLTLTDDEKREARATDPRAAAVVDRVEAMAPATMNGLHGTIRDRRDLPVDEPPPDDPFPPGTAVRLHPRPGGDAQDMFLAGRQATVQETKIDVDGIAHVGVTVDDDPASDLHQWYRRYHYFKVEELEPLGERPRAGS